MSCILLGSAMLIASCLLNFIDLIDFLFTNIMVSNRDTHLQNRTNTTVWHIQVYFKLNREKKNDNKSYHSRRMIHLLLHSFLFIFKLLPECCQLTQDVSIWCISPDRFFEKIKLNFNWRSSWLLNKFSLSVVKCKENCTKNL